MTVGNRIEQQRGLLDNIMKCAVFVCILGLTSICLGVSLAVNRATTDIKKKEENRRFCVCFECKLIDCLEGS